MIWIKAMGGTGLELGGERQGIRYPIPKIRKLRLIEVKGLYSDPGIVREFHPGLCLQTVLTLPTKDACWFPEVRASPTSPCDLPHPQLAVSQTPAPVYPDSSPLRISVSFLLTVSPGPEVTAGSPCGPQLAHRWASGLALCMHLMVLNYGQDITLGYFTPHAT